MKSQSAEPNQLYATPVPPASKVRRSAQLITAFSSWPISLPVSRKSTRKLIPIMGNFLRSASRSGQFGNPIQISLHRWEFCGPPSLAYFAKSVLDLKAKPEGMLYAIKLHDRDKTIIHQHNIDSIFTARTIAIYLYKNKMQKPSRLRPFQNGNAYGCWKKETL